MFSLIEHQLGGTLQLHHVGVGTVQHFTYLEVVSLRLSCLAESHENRNADDDPGGRLTWPGDYR